MLKRSATLFLAFGLLTASGCITSPREEPFAATRLQPAAGEELRVDQVLVYLDSSGSIDPETEFPGARALVESFVDGMPDGDYQADAVVFGGSRRHAMGLAPFNREALSAHTAKVRYLGESTGLSDLFVEASDELQGHSGTTAIVLISDGIPTIGGKRRDAEPSILAARELVDRRGGGLCLHTVQVGSDAAGEELLSQLAAMTPCGSFRSLGSAEGASNLHSFQRQVFYGTAGLPAVGAGIPATNVSSATDLDGDGVANGVDACPGTPRGARVDGSGCWLRASVLFSVDSANLSTATQQDIESYAGVLRKNPNLKVQIDGHADSTGTEPYNEKLSQRRAVSVRERLEAAGVDPAQLELVGHGESQPIASNDSSAGRAQNRRVELTILR